MEQLNPAQIKKNIKQLKQRQEQYLYYLGQLAFQAGEEGKLQDAGMLEAYGTLKDIQAQMAQGDAALEQIRVAKEVAQNPRCPQCGGSLPKGAAFCASCGANLATPPPAAVPAVVPAAPLLTGKACVNCAAPLDDDAVFCGNCGARSEEGAVAEAVPASAPALPAPPVSEMPAPPAPTAEAAPPAPEAAAMVETVTDEAGAPAAEEAAPPIEETLACPKCGADVPEKDIIFCSACGTKVRE